MLNIVYRSDLLRRIINQFIYSDVCTEVLGLGCKISSFYLSSHSKKLSFSARSRTTMIKSKEPKMEGHVFLVSDQEAATSSVFQRSIGKCIKFSGATRQH